MMRIQNPFSLSYGWYWKQRNCSKNKEIKPMVRWEIHDAGDYWAMQVQYGNANKIIIEWVQINCMPTTITFNDANAVFRRSNFMHIHFLKRKILSSMALFQSKPALFITFLSLSRVRSLKTIESWYLTRSMKLTHSIGYPGLNSRLIPNTYNRTLYYFTIFQQNSLSISLSLSLF